MTKLPAPQKDSPQDWLKAIAVWAFLGIWVWFIIGSFTNGMCRDLDRPSDERLRLCQRGDWMVGWLMTDFQKAGMTRARGIALAELGRTDEAIHLFRRSFRSIPQNADALTSTQNEALREMMAADVPEVARKLWRQALGSD